MGLIRDVKEVYGSRELLGNLVMRELRGKYKGTALGWAWSLINPLALTGIFTLVFSTIMRIDPPSAANGGKSYALFLLAGLLAWNFMVAGFTGGMGSLLGNANLIKKTYFPRSLLVISTVVAAFVSYLIESLVLAAILLIWGINILVWIPLTLVVMTLLMVFSLGLGLMFSVINVYFRDVSYLITLGIQLWFYATPIIYPLSLIEAHRQADSWFNKLHLIDIYYFNPMLHFAEAIRDMLYVGTWPSVYSLLACLGFAVVTLLCGAAVFRRMSPRLAEEL